MVIGAAVAGLILAYSVPTHAAGAHGKGSSSGASKPDISGSSNVDIGESSKVDIGETSKTKTDHIRSVHHPDMTRQVDRKTAVSGVTRGNKIELDAKGKELEAQAAIFGNQGVAGKIGAGMAPPKGALTPGGVAVQSLLGKGKEGNTGRHNDTPVYAGTTDNGDGTSTATINWIDANGKTTGVAYETTDNKTGAFVGCTGQCTDPNPPNDAPCC